MSAKFTPGPWKALIDSDGRFEIESRTHIIASRGPLSHAASESAANARLIAAATELMAELKHLVRCMEPIEETGLNIPGLATLNGARAAIAKAEGTS